MGVAGSSNAIKISQRLGLSTELIERAKQLLTDEKVSFEKVLEEAQNARKAAEKQIEEYEAINK